MPDDSLDRLVNHERDDEISANAIGTADALLILQERHWLP